MPTKMAGVELQRHDRSLISNYGKHEEQRTYVQEKYLYKIQPETVPPPPLHLVLLKHLGFALSHFTPAVRRDEQSLL
jgi:hypothetical protein